MNVGFIGTGTMGQPMVANLLKKGFAVLAWDVVPPRWRRPSSWAPPPPPR
jgi:3-hydroxyisobutyrate dehydrogenase-like beta-hydroxyacid dehydrogenase